MTEVWRMQAEAEERRRRMKLAEFERREKRKVGEQTPGARARRAAAYARFYETEVIPLRLEELSRQEEERRNRPTKEKK